MKQGVPESAVDIMSASLTQSTKSQYNTSLKQWWNYCCLNNVDFYNVKISSLLDFLTQCYQSGSSYGSLNSHRSAISLISLNAIGSDEKLKRFFKGVFKMRPTFPRYNITWDPNIVLDYLSNQYPNDSLSLEQLSKKCVVLLALATGHRTQTLSLIKIKNILEFSDKIVIPITDLIKTSGIGRPQPVLNLPFFLQRLSVCPATTLKSYVLASADKRPNTVENLFITYKRPYKNATAQTIGRWIKQTLQASGVDTAIFTAHSTRHAATSAALRAGVSVDTIRKSAGWSDQSSVFANFYNRPIVNSSPNLAQLV